MKGDDDTGVSYSAGEIALGVSDLEEEVPEVLRAVMTQNSKELEYRELTSHESPSPLP